MRKTLPLDITFDLISDKADALAAQERGETVWTWHACGDDNWLALCIASVNVLTYLVVADVQLQLPPDQEEDSDEG